MHFGGQISEFCYVKAGGIYTGTARLYGLNFPIVGLALGVSAAVIKCGFVAQVVITPASGRCCSAHSGKASKPYDTDVISSLERDCFKTAITY
jgi:hypothetical protein